MPRRRRDRNAREDGTSLVEVLVTLLIVAFGLLGVAGLQAKMSLAQMESYQRSQALLVLAEMTERIGANRTQAASYVTAGTIGTGDTQPTDCTTVAMGPSRDICEWSGHLKGAAEVTGPSKVGAMAGALGCITLVQAANGATNVCTTGIYQVSVAWQGVNATTASQLTCGQGSFGTDDAYRRLVSQAVSVGTTSCQ